MLHLAFDAMVGICSVLILLGLWLGWAWWRRRDIPRTRWFLRAAAASGVAAIVALECGWIVTEVGRQPWVVYNVMRTKDARHRSQRGVGHLLGRLGALHGAGGRHRARSCARWLIAGERPEISEAEVPYGPSEPVPPPEPAPPAGSAE